MKKVQNNVKNKSRPSLIEITTSQISDIESNASKKEKSNPKFNRKTEMQQLLKKKSDKNFASELPLCYISPKRANKQNPSCFRSPKFEDVAHKFSSALFEASAFTGSENEQSGFTSSQGFRNSFTTRRDSQESQNLQADPKIQRLQKEVQKLESQNKTIKQKCKELEGLQLFLVQREGYIYQLTEQNKKLNEELSQTRNQISQQKDKIRELQQNLELKVQTLQQERKQFQAKWEVQKVERNIMIKKNIKLKQQLKEAKQFKEQEKLHRLSRKSKQNNQTLNRKCQRERGLTKSKSVIFASSPTASPINLDVSEILQTGSVTNIDSKTVADLCDNINLTESQLRSSACSFVPLQQTDFINKSRFFDCQQEQNKKLISQLQKRIRYSQIEIDILKKMKLDSDKCKQQNSKLKSHNKKLLNRMDFLARKSVRRHCVCDSELQLSLSPVRS